MSNEKLVMSNGHSEPLGIYNLPFTIWKVKKSGK